MTRQLGCFLVVLLAWAPLHAASVGAIAGYIKDSSGTPQMGAVVEVFVSAAKVGTTVFTDSRGYYLANNLPAGTYQVKVTDRKSTRLNSSHVSESRMPSSA